MAIQTREPMEEFAENCIRCGLCARTNCGCYDNGEPCLGDICESLLSGDRTYESFPFRCALCNRCTAHCPVNLKAIECMKPARGMLLAEHPEMRDQYRHFRTDMKHNLFSLLQAKAAGNPVIGFKPVVEIAGAPAEAASTAFFPGCSLRSYAPSLVTATAQWLGEQGIAGKQLNVCCGATFFDVGFFPEFEEYRKGFQKFLTEQGITRLAICCPHCGYEMDTLLEGMDVEVVKVPELMVERGVTGPAGLRLSMHDACYDRYDGSYGDAIRALFPECEFVPLTHERRDTVCCGGGGMVSAYDRSVCEVRRNMRLGEFDEAQDQGVDDILSSCFSCVNSLQRGTSAVPVKHYLELIFGIDIVWNDVYNSVDAMYRHPICAGLLKSDTLMFEA